MMIGKQEIIRLINKELEWCIKHPAKKLSKEFQKGFKNGLSQAVLLIDQLDKEKMKDKKYNIIYPDPAWRDN